MDILLLIVIFFFVMTAVLSVYYVVNAKRLATLERLYDFQSVQEPQLDQSSDAAKAVKERWSLAKALQKVIPMHRYLEKRKSELLKARIFLKPEEYMTVAFTIGLVFFLVAWVLTRNPLFSLLFLPLGFFLPDTYVRRVKRKRSIKLNDQLPEALNIISNGLRAGLSFTQSIAVASKDLQAPIAEEFKKVVRDNALGKTMEDALLNLSQRTDDEDLDMFITALLVQRQVGGNLSEVLDTISNTIRERVRIKGEIRALTAQSRLSAMIISFLPVGIALVLFVLNPEYIMLLFTTTIGLVMIAIAFVMQGIGIFALSKLIKIEV